MFKNILFMLTIFLNYQQIKTINPTSIDLRIPSEENYPLHHHACLNHIYYIEWMVTAGEFHIDSSNHLGRTPLHYAALHGKFAAVQKLLELGAETYVLDDQYKSPQDLARINNHLYIADYINTWENL